MIGRLEFVLQAGKRKFRLGGRTLIMGILNVTPDSFSDGGRYLHPEKAVRHGIALAAAGADWIDVGGESSRPGAKPVSSEEEIRRVLPVIRALHHKIPRTPISIDTTKSEVAEAALADGAAIINDISGLRFDLRIAEVAARRHAGLILMHSRGRPETMQQQPFARDIWKSLRDGLRRSVQKAVSAGARRSQIVIDPGLGFGKSREQNYEILAHLDRLKSFGLPVLAGSSRKSFVRAAVEAPISDRHKPSELNRTLPDSLQSADAAAVVAAILGGAHIVRVHDPAALLPAIRLADAILDANN